MSLGNEFTTRSQLDNAIDLWINNESLATINYGDINTWDVSKITDFSYVFDKRHFCKEEVYFNSDVRDWNISQVNAFLNRIPLGNDLCQTLKSEKYKKRK